MKRFGKTGLITGLLLLSSMAVAQDDPLIINGQADFTVTWVNATQFEDGTALDPADITSIVLYYGTTSREGRACSEYPADTADTSCYPLITEVTTAGATSTGIILALDQTTTFHFAAVTNVSGELSKYSAEAPITLTLETDGKPGAPTSVTITADVTCVTNDPGITCHFDVQ